MALPVEWDRRARQEAASGAFERLFLAHYPLVVAIAHRVLGDAHEAEDVAQEVFTSFHRRYAPDAPFARSWLCAAAAHTALNTARGKRRRARREEAEATEFLGRQAEAQAALDPQRALEEQERANEVRAALGRLPAKSAAVLVLRYSGLSYTEVAAALGIGVGQVGTLLRRAEDALHKEISRAAHR